MALNFYANVKKAFLIYLGVLVPLAAGITTLQDARFMVFFPPNMPFHCRNGFRDTTTGV